MARIATWCVLGACTGLAACLNSSGGTNTGPFSYDPILGQLDGALPFGTSTGVSVPMFSSNLDGISAVDASIAFNADGSFTVTLPDATSVTVTAADVDVPAAADASMGTTVTSYVVGTTAVDVHIGEDTVGRDLFLLARADDLTGAVIPSPMTYVVFGDDTETLPGGTANFTGGFQATVFDNGGNYVAERTGGSAIDVDFTARSITVELNVVGEGAGEQYTGTGTIAAGTSQYSGTMDSTGGVTSYSGLFNGGFYGAGAEATAGTFNATNATATEEIIGGFTGFQ